MQLPVLKALGERNDMLELLLASPQQWQDAVCQVDRAPDARCPVPDSAIGDLKIAGKRRLPLAPIERLSHNLQNVFLTAHVPGFRKRTHFAQAIQA
jgi:hypothetical protein